MDKWKQLARRLGFKKPDIDAFDQQNAKLAEKAYLMLMEWQQNKGSAATYQVLYDALCHDLVGLRQSAERFCCWVNTES